MSPFATINQAIVQTYITEYLYIKNLKKKKSKWGQSSRCSWNTLVENFGHGQFTYRLRYSIGTLEYSLQLIAFPFDFIIKDIRYLISDFLTFFKSKDRINDSYQNTNEKQEMKWCDRHSPKPDLTTAPLARVWATSLVDLLAKTNFTFYLLNDLQIKLPSHS